MGDVDVSVSGEISDLILAGLGKQSKEQIAEFFNNTADTMGNYLLHVCANYGSCELKIWQLVRCADTLKTMLWTNY